MEKGNGKETSMLENTKMGNEMVKEHTQGLMETSMSENGRMEKEMVKGHPLTMMEGSM